MGNRAVITDTNKQVGIYLHWNGGRDSVEAFLKYCELQGFRSPTTDCYGWARLTQVIANFFGGGLSVGIGSLNQIGTNPGDNGLYIIKGWEIVGRDNAPTFEQKEHNLIESLREIDTAQPKEMQIPEKINQFEHSLKEAVK